MFHQIVAAASSVQKVKLKAGLFTNRRIATNVNQVFMCLMKGRDGAYLVLSDSFQVKVEQVATLVAKANLHSMSLQPLVRSAQNSVLESIRQKPAIMMQTLFSAHASCAKLESTLKNHVQVGKIQFARIVSLASIMRWR